MIKRGPVLYDTRISYDTIWSENWVNACLRVCVLHIKSLFLPVDIQRNQCPCRFFYPGEIQTLWSRNNATEVIHCYAVSPVDNANATLHTGYDRYDMHIIWKIENRMNKTNQNKAKQKQNQKRETLRKEEIQTVVPPRKGCVWNYRTS